MHRTRGTRGGRRPGPAGTARGPLLALVLALAAVVTACGDSTVAGPAGVDTGSTTTSTTPVATTGVTTTSVGGTASSEAGATTSTFVPTTAAGLPGTPFNMGPAAGTRLAVVGVRYDDVLNFRTVPDPTAPIVATVAPLAASPPVVSAGQGRLLDRAAWWLVTVDGNPAWANRAFLGALGTSTDVGDSLRAALASPDATDIDSLVTAIAKAVSAQDPPSTVVVSARPAPDAVAFDVMGLGDDAVAGLRFAITVTPRAGGGVRLATAARTDICSRGVSNGLCT